MIRKGCMIILMLMLMPIAALAQGTGSLTGVVTDASTGDPLPGANVVLQGTDIGAATSINGEYEITGIPAGTYDVRASFVGYQLVTVEDVTIAAGTTSELDFNLNPGRQLDELVVTALGIERAERAITYSAQEVDAAELNVTQDINLKTALAGKVAGLQMVGQAGSKLGDFGAIRIRGAISLTDELAEPLYVVDGVPVPDPNLIDMNNVAEISVLKGPNATALYGQRGENGVVLLTTQSGREASGLRIEFSNSTTWQDVAYLPSYQNEYGQGYEGEAEWATFQYDPDVHPEYFEPMDGARYIASQYADESWGPRFDDEEYAAWYNWFPDSPDYGQRETYEASPDNIENFFDTALQSNSSVAVSYAGDQYSTRVSYSNLTQNGLIPYSSLNKHFLNGRFNYDFTDNFRVNARVNYTTQGIEGDVWDDDYSNQTTGMFNQWFARNIEADKMRELRDLTNPEGYLVSWNWWGPDNYALGGAPYQKPTFWYNPYTWMERYNVDRDSDQMLLNASVGYDLTEAWSISAMGSYARDEYNRRYELPFSITNSAAPGLYNEWVNAFGEMNEDFNEANFDGIVNYQNEFGAWSVDALGGGTIRDESFTHFSADMDLGNSASGGLIIPDVYQYGNSREQVVPDEYNWDKRVYSLYSRATVGYNDLLYLEGSFRQDWSSALPSDHNGYGYPSIGASFVFSELLDTDVLSFGKVRASWAQVGDDVDAEDVLQSYFLSSNPYTNPQTGAAAALLHTAETEVDPNIEPALNSSFETGVDLRFLNDRLGFTATYYNETRENEIIAISLSSAYGATGYLTNAGSAERQGVELSLDIAPIQTQDFRWNARLNWATNETIVTSLPQDLRTYEVSTALDNAFGFVTLTHRLDEEWGQIRGAAIARTDDGSPILNPETGLYVVEQGQFLGSVLPDWTGGFLNTFGYKNVSLTASIDFQKGGNFFSLSEMWGQYSGLLEETAGNNDLGNPKRDPVFDDEGNPLPEDARGGVHVTGVSPDGEPVDMYVAADSYYMQWYSNRLAEPFVHDASYVKLREVNLSYALPQRWIGGFARSASIGVVGRNLWMIAVSDDNPHGWDPSEMSATWGENGQLPGTRSFGINTRITF